VDKPELALSARYVTNLEEMASHCAVTALRPAHPMQQLREHCFLGYQGMSLELPPELCSGATPSSPCSSEGLSWYARGSPGAYQEPGGGGVVSWCSGSTPKARVLQWRYATPRPQGYSDDAPGSPGYSDAAPRPPGYSDAGEHETWRPTLLPLGFRTEIVQWPSAYRVAAVTLLLYCSWGTLQFQSVEAAWSWLF